MARIVSNPCPCGRRIKATDPEPGDEMRCYYCGHLLVYGGEGPGDEDSLLAGPISARLDGLDALLEELAPGELTCTGCASPMSVIQRDGGDKVARCEYCGSEVDLPERRGVRRRQVKRSPGRTEILEESAWVEEISGGDSYLDPPDAGFDGDGSAESEGDGPAEPVTAETEINISFEGDPDDPENFARFLRQVHDELPPGQAKSVISEFKRMMRRRR